MEALDAREHFNRVKMLINDAQGSPEMNIVVLDGSSRDIPRRCCCCSKTIEALHRRTVGSLPLIFTQRFYWSDLFLQTLRTCTDELAPKLEGGMILLTVSRLLSNQSAPADCLRVTFRRGLKESSKTSLV